jgi:thiol:disulfide interchange protein DsbG
MVTTAVYGFLGVILALILWLVVAVVAKKTAWQRVCLWLLLAASVLFMLFAVVAGQRHTAARDSDHLLRQQAAAPVQTAAPNVAAMVAATRSITTTQPISAPSTYAMAGEWDGELPKSMVALDKLLAFTEGDSDGVPADTVYIMFDPRCPYCHEAFRNVRDYVKAGRRIKWIPVPILGNKEQGEKIIAAIQAKPELLAAVMESRANIDLITKDVVVSPELEQSLNYNIAFMMAAFKNSQYPQAGVPAWFWLNRHDNVADMRINITPDDLKSIWGTL